MQREVLPNTSVLRVWWTGVVLGGLLLWLRWLNEDFCRNFFVCNILSTIVRVRCAHSHVSQPPKHTSNTIQTLDGRVMWKGYFSMKSLKKSREKHLSDCEKHVKITQKHSDRQHSHRKIICRLMYREFSKFILLTHLTHKF